MTAPRIAIIGAGFGGVGTAVRLKKAGHGNFTIFERAERAGGCWLYNNYPGAEVDTESESYRFSFMPHTWTRSHAQRDELLGYIDSVIGRFDLGSHLRYDSTVSSVTWLPDRNAYEVCVEGQAPELYQVVISAVGFLSEPRTPDWPGLETFEGEVIHPGLWDSDIDLTGKHVAVVGTGSTSASLVPAIIDRVQSLTLFQREPAWILPKPVIEYQGAELTPATDRRHRLKRARSLHRMQRLFRGGKTYQVGTRQNQKLEQQSRRFMAEELADRPDLRAALQPNYPIFGKRIVLSSDFYASLRNEKATLVPAALDQIQAGGLVDALGVSHRADVLIAAIGFKAADYLSSLHVVGRTGRSLTEAWAGDPRALFGIAVPDFPNFFIVYGPNTNGSGALLFMQEAQSRFIVRSITALVKSGSATVEVKPQALATYYKWLDAEMQKSVFFSTANYYRGASGRIVTNWPRGFYLYAFLLRLLRRHSMLLDKAPVAGPRLYDPTVASP